MNMTTFLEIVLLFVVLIVWRLFRWRHKRRWSARGRNNRHVRRLSIHIC